MLVSLVLCFHVRIIRIPLEFEEPDVNLLPIMKMCHINYVQVD
jgi:hypothetical protein